ncbi:hypothetical protein [Actinacidiphila bryophytorum]|uniref:YtkA-like domain-containing protein n=1 Tax=Actinacidiphila bryophytorum TaxID=1436133 RepID=A0A9W4EC18_9ACTN|nr:hypothetical protein [Actinacidiphila bryophytorum]MBM9436627.1 hypothetical protein [Actinacidiphila bryophytorum]MBN6546717.1 hypothetical protein [Actinacidiphila bryophytorum]CAG7599161.1 conserved exported hypothetical protein [Actinacidiphila bryophytorum]
MSKNIRFALLAAATLAVTLTACGHSSTHSMPGMDHTATAMPGMDHNMAPGTGLSAAEDGYRLTAEAATLPAARQTPYRFTITGQNGTPVTDFTVEQTKRMHFYAIRSDLTGFQHLHPTMAADGTWTADLASLTPGAWRMFASFTPVSGKDVVLSLPVTVPGTAAKMPLPAPASSTEVDGYAVTVTGDPMAGMTGPLNVTVTRAGKPVTDLQPYLGTYAHLTAFHEGDAAFAHLHPVTEATGTRGGPDLAFHADLPTSGNWRLFLQFQTDGTLHTAAVTLPVA